MALNFASSVPRPDLQELRVPDGPLLRVGQICRIGNQAHPRTVRGRFVKIMSLHFETDVSEYVARISFIEEADFVDRFIRNDDGTFNCLPDTLDPIETNSETINI